MDENNRKNGEGNREGEGKVRSNRTEILATRKGSVAGKGIFNGMD